MKTRTMILCALFAALTAVGAFFKIPFALLHKRVGPAPERQKAAPTVRTSASIFS